MSRDEQIRWWALRIAHANKPSFATQVVHEPPNVLKRGDVYEAYLRGVEIPEWTPDEASHD